MLAEKNYTFYCCYCMIFLFLFNPPFLTLNFLSRVIVQKQPWPTYQSSPVSETENSVIKCEPDHLTIPDDGMDVWEIDLKHLIPSLDHSCGWLV